MKHILFLTIISALLLTACKPSEKNYRIAYETAQQKARADLAEGEYELMQEQLLPPMMHGDTDSVHVHRAHLMWQWSPQAVDSGKRRNPMRYNLAVGAYRMLTNAKGHAETLTAAGFPAVVMRAAALPFLSNANTGIANSTATTYYVIASLSDNLDSIAAAAHRFTASQQPVGMPVPVALQTRP